MPDYTKEDKELILEEIRQHREEIFKHLGEIETLVNELDREDIRARMWAYWLPSIKGSLGDEDYPNTIMVSLEDTIKEIEED